MDPVPVEIRLRRKSRLLAVRYDNGEFYELGFEYLRVHSPSAEVRGHGRDEAVLQTGKERVMIDAVEPVGRYAVRLRFDDGHDTGLYTWTYLRELGREQATRWQAYLDRLEQAGYARSEPGDD